MKITLCRTGFNVKNEVFNVYKKGRFTKDFDSLESLVKFLVIKKDIFIAPCIGKELGLKQFKVFIKKFRSFNKKWSAFERNCHE